MAKIITHVNLELSRTNMSKILSMLREDILRTYKYAQGSGLRKVLVSGLAPGVHAVIVLRFGQALLLCPVYLRIFLEPIYFLASILVRVVWGIEIPRSANIGPGLYIGHFGGINISPAARIGKNCNISQQVTIGVSGKGGNRGVPEIGDNVYIAPGSRLFGKISIGNNCKIGADMVVHKNIPDNAIVVLDPGFRIISYSGNREPEDVSLQNEIQTLP